MKTRDAKSQSAKDLHQFNSTEELFESDPIDLIEKIEAFPKYATRQSIAKFITKYELFKKLLTVNGSIIECGVLHGAGLMTWAKLSSIFEPANHVRKIIGFDSFSGFPDVAAEDTDTGSFNELKKGGLAGSSYEHILEAISVYDSNRAIAHIPKIELVKGDFCKTAEEYLEANPHLVVAMLYLDFDLYEPTKRAIELFLPRMPKGAILVFDELNAKIFPGETMAVVDTLGLNKLRIERFPFDSYVSYAILD
jgi:hypothetical protein